MLSQMSQMIYIYKAQNVEPNEPSDLYIYTILRPPISGITAERPNRRTGARPLAHTYVT